MSDSREKFEAWWNARPSFKLKDRPLAMEAWQACEASREFVVELPFRPVLFHNLITLTEVKGAIESAGGRVK